MDFRLQKKLPVMKHIKKMIGSLLFLAISISSCNSQPSQIQTPTDTLPIHIQRFDKALLQFIETQDTALEQELLKEYPAMLEITGKGILNLQSPAVPGFFDQLVSYYSEPTLKNLYEDAVHEYQDVSDIESQLGKGFAFLKANFPGMQVPACYMHVSGFNQNVLAADSLLSLSIDKYMGEAYPLYQDFFYDYQRIKMQRPLVAADYLAGWLMSEYPFEGNENVLLDRMIYEGKIKYIVHLALPEITPAQLMGYKEKDYAWCTANELTLWNTIIQRKHLYTPDQLTTSKYLDDKPCTFLSDETPGNIGTWIGWQIVSSYMKENNVSLQTLMQQQNAQELLSQAKYKP